LAGILAVKFTLIQQVDVTLRGAKTEIVWSTRADWEKGEITGAVGFEPVGRLLDQ